MHRSATSSQDDTFRILSSDLYFLAVALDILLKRLIKQISGPFSPDLSQYIQRLP